MSSQTTEVFALYSALADDQETVCCFLDFQEINDLPRKTQQHVIDLLVSGHPAQSEFEKAFN